MAQRPNYGPHWATNHSLEPAGSDPEVNPVIQPSSSKRADGWAVGPVPFQTLNGIQAEIGEWLDYLHRSAGQFAQPTQAKTAGLEPGDTFVSGASVRNGAHPGSGGETATTGWVDFDHDGEFLVMLDQGVLASVVGRVVVKDLSGATATRTHSVGAIADLSAIACNGTYIAVARANSSGNVIVMDYDGVTQFSFQHGAAVRGLFMDETHVVAVGAPDGDDNGVIAHTLSDGLLAWETEHTPGPLWSVTGDGEFYYVAGQFDGSADNLKRLVKATGAVDDAITLTTDVFGRGRVAVGPHSLFVATTSSGSDLLTIREVTKRGDLAEIDTLDLTALGAWSGNLAIDDRYLYVRLGDFVYAIPYGSGHLERAFLRSQRLANLLAGPALTTGQYIHVLQTANIRHFGIGRRAGIWNYLEPSGQTWFRRKFVPGDS